jgi:hypothetical protein
MNYNPICGKVANGLRRARALPLAACRTAGAASGRAPLGEAIRLLIGNAFLISTTVMFLVFNFGLGLVLVWLPVFADTRLAGGAAGYGLMLAARPIGGAIAGLVIDPTALGPVILLSAVLIGTPGLLGLAVRDLREARPPR